MLPLSHATVHAETKPGVRRVSKLRQRARHVVFERTFDLVGAAAASEKAGLA